MNPAELRALMRRHGIRAGRRLGQHFLFDSRILRRIAAAAQIVAGAPVLEVGPGLGVLTLELLRAGGCVTAVEVDRSLRPALLEVLGVPDAPPPAPWLGTLRGDVLPTARLVWADAVRLPWGALAAQEPGPWRLCSNLPYYITGPFLASFLEGGLPWSTAVLLVQQEAAARLAAAPGGKDYGALTCLVGYHAEVERLFPVPRGAFLPPPAVASAVVRLRRRPSAPTPVASAPLMRVVRAAFAVRRKTLRNALRARYAAPAALLDEALAAAGVDGTRRGETLSLQEFGRLALALASAGVGD